MYIDIQKHQISYVIVLIEKRISFLKNKITKEKKEDWYDFEPAQIEMKLCEISNEYYRLKQMLEQFYTIK